MSRQLDKDQITDWIKTSMAGFGHLEAYSYQVGMYHGLKRVLEQIELGTFDKEACHNDQRSPTIQDPVQGKDKEPKDGNHKQAFD